MLHGWSIFKGWKKHGNTPKSCFEYVNPLWQFHKTLVLLLHSKREWSNLGYNCCKNNGPPAYQSYYFGGKIVLPNMIWVSSQFPMTALFLLHTVMTISRKREEFPTHTTGHLFSSLSLPYCLPVHSSTQFSTCQFLYFPFLSSLPSLPPFILSSFHSFCILKFIHLLSTYAASNIL